MGVGAADGTPRTADARPDVAKVSARKLFVAAQADDGAPAAVASFMESASGSKTQQIYPGADHGTALLKGASGTLLRELLQTFLGGP